MVKFWGFHLNIHTIKLYYIWLQFSKDATEQDNSPTACICAIFIL